MKIIPAKNINVKVKKGEESLYMALYSSFGYSLAAAHAEKDYTVFNLFRPANFPNNKKALGKEKQFNKINAKFPTSPLIFTVLGIALLIVGFFLNATVPLASIICLILGGIILAGGLVMFIAFLVAKLNKKHLVEIIVQGDRPKMPDLRPFQIVEPEQTTKK